MEVVKNKQWLRYMAGIVTGVLVSVAVFIIFPETNIKVNQVRNSSNSYKFINPLLECEFGSSISKELKSFKGNIVDHIDDIKNSNRASFVSVYFRDLNNGPWFGINEMEKFSPASLLKIPIAMSIFKKSESKNILNDKIVFSKKTDDSEEYFKQKVIDLGQTYSVDELIKSMIVNSDNEAKNLLLINNIPDNIGEIFSYFNIDLSKNDMDISVKQYATFLRILFNASYLNHDNSERMLSLLSEVKFDKGLRAGVPKDIKVAHKFGEREDKTLEVQLHDCGIVYYPEHPYILCIMTRGFGFDDLAAVIADISKYVYTEVDKQYSER